MRVYSRLTRSSPTITTRVIAGVIAILSLGLIVGPAQHANAIDDDPPEFVYRADTRPPEEIFQTGFYSWAAEFGRVPNYNIAAHAYGTSLLQRRSPFVSTTRSLGVAHSIADLLRRHSVVNGPIDPYVTVWIYQIRATHDFYSMNTAIDAMIRSLSSGGIDTADGHTARFIRSWSTITRWEQEWVSVAPIVGSSIVGATRHDGVPQTNPNHTPTTTRGNSVVWTSNSEDPTLRDANPLGHASDSRSNWVSAAFSTCLGIFHPSSPGRSTCDDEHKTMHIPAEIASFNLDGTREYVHPLSSWSQFERLGWSDVDAFLPSSDGRFYAFSGSEVATLGWDGTIESTAHLRDWNQFRRLGWSKVDAFLPESPRRFYAFSGKDVAYLDWDGTVISSGKISSWNVFRSLQWDSVDAILPAEGNHYYAFKGDTVAYADLGDNLLHWESLETWTQFRGLGWKRVDAILPGPGKTFFATGRLR